MRPRKTSKSTHKVGQESAAGTPENSKPAQEANVKRRTSTKRETGETGRAKHRNTNAPEPAKFPSRAVDSAVIDAVGVMTSSSDSLDVSPTPVETSFARAIAHEHIAKLAHFYWIARGYAHGFDQEDWHRAERDLKNKH